MVDPNSVYPVSRRVDVEGLSLPLFRASKERTTPFDCLAGAQDRLMASGNEATAMNVSIASPQSNRRKFLERSRRIGGLLSCQQNTLFNKFAPLRIIAHHVDAVERNHFTAFQIDD